jgi:UDP-N-acetylglucosamine 2-epimerase (non-hydrolysing)
VSVKVANVVGTRPNFMKIAPIMRAMLADSFFQPRLVHTGQHYDREMSQIFFEDLGIPPPDIDLSVGSGAHGRQTGEVMLRFEETVTAEKQDLVVVVGDVNSTLAAALVAVKLHIPVAHVEAGLRSFDRTMPEEINRILTDAVSEFLFVTEKSAIGNLRAEGVAEDRIHFVGNVMIDVLLANRRRAAETDVVERLGLAEGGYIALTLHRPSNVDTTEPLQRIVRALERIAAKTPVVFPAHPRSLRNLEIFNLLARLENAGVMIVPPLGYLEFLRLMDASAAVLTDSGGLQEETTVLGIPCVTLRDNTERPVTVEEGTNVLVGNDTGKIVAATTEALSRGRSQARIPPLWDGKAAERIIAVLKDRFERAG